MTRLITPQAFCRRDRKSLCLGRSRSRDWGVYRRNRVAPPGKQHPGTRTKGLKQNLTKSEKNGRLHSRSWRSRRASASCRGSTDRTRRENGRQGSRDTPRPDPRPPVSGTVPRKRPPVSPPSDSGRALPGFPPAVTRTPVPQHRPNTQQTSAHAEVGGSHRNVQS